MCCFPFNSEKSRPIDRTGKDSKGLGVKLKSCLRGNVESFNPKPKKLIFTPHQSIMQLRETQNQINHRFTFTTGAITQEIELWFYVQSSTVSSSRNDLY